MSCLYVMKQHCKRRQDGSLVLRRLASVNEFREFRRVRETSGVGATAGRNRHIDNVVIRIVHEVFRLAAVPLGDFDLFAVAERPKWFSVLLRSTRRDSGFAGEFRLFFIFDLDSERARLRGGFVHVYTQIFDSIGERGDSKRERHTRLCIRSSNGDIVLGHVEPTLLHCRFGPAYNSVLQQSFFGLELLVRRAVVPLQVVLVQNGHLEVAEGFVAGIIVYSVRKCVNPSRKLGSGVFAATFLDVDVASSVVVVSRLGVTGLHSVDVVISRQRDCKRGGTVGEVRLLTSVSHFESERS
mmetsp:Transcript_22879/g.40505  ORF Transcript_22879/g.40505 Transcript_22879/m.40505 type:complete len:297 (+) Transcript_22879:404-1294(+)